MQIIIEEKRKVTILNNCDLACPGMSDFMLITQETTGLPVEFICLGNSLE